MRLGLRWTHTAHADDGAPKQATLDVRAPPTREFGGQGGSGHNQWSWNVRQQASLYFFLDKLCSNVAMPSISRSVGEIRICKVRSGRADMTAQGTIAAILREQSAEPHATPLPDIAEDEGPGLGQT